MTPKYHILFFHHVSFIGGAEQVLLATARDLEAKTFTKTLITQEEGPLTAAFRDIGGNVLCAPLPAWRKGKNILSRYLVIEDLVRLARALSPALILTNNYRLAPYASAVARRCGVPSVLHLHDPLTLKHVEGFRIRRVRHIVAAAEFLRQRLVNFGIVAETIPFGIDAERFVFARPLDLAKEFSFPGGCRFVGMVANFTENKRHRLFLEIARAIKSQSGDFRFLSVGHNAWDTEVSQEKLQALANEKGLEREMVFTGWRDDVPHILRALDAVVVPSEYETFPLVVLEAMAAGAVVFAQKGSGGPDEQIADGQDGFLIDCADSEESARKIIAVLNDRDLRARIARAAQDKARVRFSRAHYQHKMRGYLMSILEEHRLLREWDSTDLAEAKT